MYSRRRLHPSPSYVPFWIDWAHHGPHLPDPPAPAAPRLSPPAADRLPLRLRTKRCARPVRAHHPRSLRPRARRPAAHPVRSRPTLRRRHLRQRLLRHAHPQHSRPLRSRRFLLHHQQLPLRLPNPAPLPRRLGRQRRRLLCIQQLRARPALRPRTLQPAHCLHRPRRQRGHHRRSRVGALAFHEFRNSPRRNLYQHARHRQRLPQRPTARRHPHRRSSRAATESLPRIRQALRPRRRA